MIIWEDDELRLEEDNGKYSLTLYDEVGSTHLIYADVSLIDIDDLRDSLRYAQSRFYNHLNPAPQKEQQQTYQYTVTALDAEGNEVPLNYATTITDEDLP